MLPAAASAEADSMPGILQVSPELMIALEEWSSPGVSLETLAAEQYPEAIIGYSQKVEAIYQGLTIPEHFANKYPEVYAEVIEVTRDGAIDSASFAAYVMTHMPAVYAKWQQEDILVTYGLTFSKFVSGYHPEILEDLAVKSETPASRGKLFIDFVQGLENGEELYPLALSLLQEVEAIPFDPTFDCECWMTVAFERTPTDWRIQRDRRDTPRPRAISEGRMSLEARAKGAAREVDFYRLSRNQQHTAGALLQINSSAMRVRMHCTEAGVLGGQECRGSGCSGDMATRVIYASDLSEEVFSGWFFPHGSESLAADEAELTHSSPGSSRTLFEKAAAVAGSTQVTWNLQALSTIVQGFGNAVEQAASGDANWGAVVGNLLDSTVQGIAGLLTVEGQNGPLSQEWYVAYDTTADGPIRLRPNETHVLQLDSRAEVRGTGHGIRSESWADIESGYSFAAVFRNFSCNLGAGAPDSGACWSWATSGEPMTIGDFKGGISAFVSTELGWNPATLPNNHCEWFP